MICPFCGHTLNFITEVLALTQTGAQCPSCWNHVSPRRGTPANPSLGTSLPLESKTHGHRIPVRRAVRSSK